MVDMPPVVELDTSMGAIVIELNEEKAPKTVENFLNYVKSGQYEGTIFHRIIDGFMIQGGGMDEQMNEKPTKRPVENEADNGLKNDKGTIAMARTQDPHSATSQFFVNVKDNDFLNHTGKNAQGWGYTVFGKVTSGMDEQMNEKPTKRPVENEADNGLKNDKGTIAMARTQDPHSATSQFFVNVKDNDFLNHTGKNAQGWGYTVFGKVTSGMDVIEKMRGVPTGRFGMHADVPKTPVTINSAKIISE